MIQIICVQKNANYLCLVGYTDYRPMYRLVVVDLFQNSSTAYKFVVLSHFFWTNCNISSSSFIISKLSKSLTRVHFTSFSHNFFENYFITAFIYDNKVSQWMLEIRRVFFKVSRRNYNKLLLVRFPILVSV